MEMWINRRFQPRLLSLYLEDRDQQQPWQVMATIDQAVIRGSETNYNDPSGAASDYIRESG